MEKRFVFPFVVGILLFSLFSLAWGADRGPINSGETKIGLNITAPSYMDTWTFQGNAGDRVVISAVTTAGNLDTTIYLYPPGGGPVEANTYHNYLGSIWGDDQLGWQLQHTGLYTIVIQDAIVSRTGTYNITLLKIPGAVSSTEDQDGGGIASGQTLSGTINAASDTDAFQFYGNAGARIIITVVTTAGSLDTTIYLYPPGGGPAEANTYHNYLGSIWGDDRLDWQLQQTGLYTIVIEDATVNRTGTYNISFLKLPEAVSSIEDQDGGGIASGQTLSGTINVASDMDAFQFYGNAADRVIITAVTAAGNLDTTIYLYPPGGGPAEANTYHNFLGSIWGDDRLDWQLQQTGLYTIVIEDATVNRTGTYSISLTKIPSDLRPGLYNPSPQNGARLCSVTGSFSWDAVAGATGYDLYFREGFVGAATKIGNNLSAPSMPFPLLEAGNVYYWEVVVHTPGGDIAGPVWWFEVSNGETGWVEDFESHAIGTFPFPVGWFMWYDGGNPSSQYVDNSHAASGSKSLHLAASPSGYPAAAYIESGCLSTIKLETEVFIDQIASCGVHNTSAGVFLSDPKSGATFGAVRFKCDGNIYAVKDNLTDVLVQLRPYSSQTWYHVVLYINLNAMSYDVYINGALEGSGIDILNTGTPTGIVLGAGASNVWFDDVKVFLEAAPPIPAPPTATEATSITATGFTANWGTITGAPEYHLDVATDSNFTTFATGYNNLRACDSWGQCGYTAWGVTGLSPGTTYYYRVRAYNSYGTSANSNTISVTTVASDTTPDPFAFTNQTGVAVNTLVTSNTITVSGINAPVPISITDGEYSTGSCGGFGQEECIFTSTPGTVNNSDTVRVRLASSSSYSTTTSTTLTIGGVSATFSVTTVASDTTPDPFAFTNQTGVAVNTLVTSNTITVSGINAPAPISLTGGEYSTGSCGGFGQEECIFTSAPGTVNNGDTVRVRLVSSGSYSTTTSTTLTIDGVSATFSVTTSAVSDAVPIPGLFNTGVSDDNTLLPDGATDPHYTLIASADPSFPGPLTKVVNSSGYPIPPWIANGPNSKWIAPRADEITSPTGIYTYRITFDLTGLDHSSAVITGQWTTDNDGVDILINGMSTGFTTPGDAFAQGFFLFTIGSGFVPDTNTLDFVVHNGVPGGDNPTGLRVELSGTANVAPGQGANYSLADLTGTWHVNKLGSGPAPYWLRGTSNNNPDGTYTWSYTKSDGSSGNGSGTLFISEDGVITEAGAPSLQCRMDPGKTVAVCTSTANDGTALLSVNVKKGSSYSLADLTGTWHVSQLGLGPTPYWLRGTSIHNPDGTYTWSYTRSNGSSGNGSGTLFISEDGVITEAGDPGLQCGMDSGKTIAACTYTAGDGTTVLAVNVKQGPSYSLDDLTGTWGVNHLGSGPTPYWIRGTSAHNSDGTYTWSYERSDGSSANGSGTLFISEDGVITEAGVPSLQCGMDPGKTIVACTYTTGDGTTVMAVNLKVSDEITADLSATMTEAPDPVTVGNNLTYTITVANNGPANATGVVATDTLPPGIVLVSATPSQGTCNGVSTVNCNLGTIDASDSATITLVVGTAQEPMTLINTVIVTANEPDPDMTNNAATTVTTTVCTVPGTPSSLTPSNGAAGVSPAPTLDWSDISGATTYDIQLCSDSDCASVVRSANVASSQWTVWPALSTGTTYYWRARANNSCRSGSYTGTWSFTTMTPGTLQFSSVTYSVNENGGTATITVTRTAGSHGAVGVSYSTSNGTATAGADYAATNETLTWTDGDSSNKTFTVSITNDALDEANETFTVTLTNPTGGASLGSPSSAVVTITDDDPAGPNISVSPGSKGFGQINVGSSAYQIFEISNTGDADLIIGTITLSGTDFKIKEGKDTCSGKTVLPSGKCTVKVAFSPTSGGPKSDNLSIPSNDPDTPLPVGLSGIGKGQPEFVDCQEGSFAENFINTLFYSGVTGGCAPGYFCPGASVTRQQMAVFIITAMGETSSTAGTNDYFDDVAEPYAGFINRMNELGITGGCGQRTYCPNDSLTRGQMAVFIIVAMRETVSTVPYNENFDDIVDDVFADFINRMKELGITGGCGDRTYCPAKSTARSEMAVFLVTSFLDN